MWEEDVGTKIWDDQMELRKAHPETSERWKSVDAEGNGYPIRAVLPFPGDLPGCWPVTVSDKRASLPSRRPPSQNGGVAQAWVNPFGVLFQAPYQQCRARAKGIGQSIITLRKQVRK